ncbi:MAG: hypothetical protein LBQ33_05290 [Oscillospiraceae bacterium]|jgi:NTP pyrophosphatase (non-canonical NTP hydrolase)|nr:hypothetical protein [Oscillospiraceae bacterium]
MTIRFTKHQIAVMQTALDRWGVNAQAGQTVEECAELIVALTKHINRTPKPESLENVIDEMADVEMMLAQMRLVSGISDERLHEQIARKFEKLERHLKNEKETNAL